MSATRPRRSAPMRWPHMLDMQPLLDRRTEGFSQGERMKTALARALVHDPPNIVLDEPTNGLDVLATRALRESLRRLRDDAGQVHRVLDPHHAGGRAPVRPRHRRLARPHRGRRARVAELNARPGEHDFEETFVQLAFTRRATQPPRWREGRARMRHGDAWIVFRKELLDALRDRRTLVDGAAALGGDRAAGADRDVGAGRRHREARRGARPCSSPGIEHAPTLRNYLLAPDLSRQCGARRLRAAAEATNRWATRCSWSARTSRPSWRAARRRWSRLSAAAPTSAPARSVGRLTRLLRGFNQRAGDAAAGAARRVAGGAGGAAGRGARPGQPAVARRAAGQHGAVLRPDGGAVRRARTPRSTPPPASASAARSSRC